MAQRGITRQYSRLPTLAADLVRSRVAVIVAIGDIALTRSIDPTLPYITIMCSRVIQSSGRV